MQYDAAWAQANVAAVAPVIEALKSYKEKHQRYPDQLEALIPEFLSTIPTTSQKKGELDAGSWRYKAINENDYLLQITTLHWISSHDALIYKHSKTYPEDWHEGHPHIDVGNGWVYVVGAQKLKFL